MRQAEFETKLARIRAFLKEHQLKAAALSSQALFAWATAGGDNHVVMASDNGVATFVVTPDRLAVLSTNIESNRIRNEEFKGVEASGIEFWPYDWHGSSGASDVLNKQLGKEGWASDLGPGPAKLGEDFQRLTYTLCPQEISRYRKLGKDCSQALEEALEKIRPGDSEHHVAGQICSRALDRGVRPHVVLVASDERAFAVRHPCPKDKKIKKHLMGVLCGKRGGLIVALTRMMHFGRKLQDELRRKHDAVCAVDVAFNAATRAGTKLNAIFAAGVAEYARQGFAKEWTFHHQGGPTGYQGRSYLGKPAEERVVLEHQAFAWNPSIAGTKSEDTVLADASGVEFISEPSRNWPVLKLKTGGKTWRRADIKLV
jgi:Xaa-Pro aminopeptidase